MIGIQPSIFGISFDGLAISGIVNEFVNVASVMRSDRYRVLLDLGYDITLDRTPNLGSDYLPTWVESMRCLGESLPIGYTYDVIQEATSRVIAGTSISATKEYEPLCAELTTKLLAAFESQNARFLIVENGTLPDNPLFTEAVYRAIAEYGNRRRLSKFVLWRDHDLMWSEEPHQYGSYPYRGVRRPQPSEYIHNAVATEWMRKRLLAWSPSITCEVIPNRFDFPKKLAYGKKNLRSVYGIPDDAYLIARCTRIIPQKAIERDLHLVQRLKERLMGLGNKQKVVLFISGLVREDRSEYERLRILQEELSLTDNIVWGDGLLSFNHFNNDPAQQKERFTVRDLLAESDLNSFLTSYDYEGFGNPPGEAMAMGVPYIATTYELYHEVYGSKGAIAPLLPIGRNDSPASDIPEFFLDEVIRLLTDRQFREKVVARNYEVCQRHFSLESLKRQIDNLFDIS